MQISYQPLELVHYDGVLILANQVHGENYLNPDSLAGLHKDGVIQDLNASWVALQDDELIGFRLTQAANQWPIDEWCSPELWQVPTDKVAYFKCNTVKPSLQGHGIGSRLLSLSIDTLKKQGSEAGLAHIWLASPGNSAYRYFKSCGGELIKEHPNRWRSLSINEGYHCPVCGDLCHCTAAEMIIRF